MKNFIPLRFGLSSALIFLLSCAAEPLPEFSPPGLDPAPVPEVPATPFAVTPEQALERAGRYLSATRGRVSATTCEQFVADPATRSAEGGESPEVAFYAINYEGGGYALVSADQRATAVYAYSETGTLYPEDFETHPGLAIFMEGAVACYRDEVASSPYSIGPFTPSTGPGSQYGDIPFLMIEEVDGVKYHVRVEDDPGDKIGPLIQTNWHQESPYNYCCSPNLVGCGPVAAGQIMAYHRHPSGYNGFVFDWDSILSGSDAGNMEASNLMVCIGNDAGAKYGTSKTSTQIGDMKRTFVHFGYACTNPEQYADDKVLNSMKISQPVYIQGFEGDSGHAWVIDGYSCTFRTKTYYKYGVPYNVCKTETIVITPVYYHCNLGWGGLYDGNYLSDTYLYPQNLKLIYAIYPLR